MLDWRIFQRNKLELLAKLNVKWLPAGSLFNTFYQFVLCERELTIELTIVDYSLRPKKLLHVVSLNLFDNMILHFVFTWSLSSPFSDVLSFIVQLCLTFLLDISLCNFWVFELWALSEHFKILWFLALHSLQTWFKVLISIPSLLGGIERCDMFWE